MFKYLKMFYAMFFSTIFLGIEDGTVIPAVTPDPPKIDDPSKVPDKDGNKDRPLAIDFSDMTEDKFNKLIEDNVNKGIEDKKKEWASETDRRVSKFVKDNEALKRGLEEERIKQMTAAEKLEYENTQRELKEKEEAEKYKIIAKDNLVNEYVLDNNLNPKSRKLIKAETKEEIEENVKLLEEIITEAINTNNQEWMRKQGKIGSGDDTDTLESLEAKYEELLKKDNLSPKERVLLIELGEKVQQKRKEKR